MSTMVRIDLICLRGAWAHVLSSEAFMVFIMVMSLKSVSMAIPAIVCGGMLTLFYGLFAADEAGNWQGYRLTLPLSRRQAVAGRYASGLLVIIVTLAVGTVLAFASRALLCALEGTGLGNFAREVLENSGTLEMALASMGGVVAAVLMLSIMLPFVARSGFTKAVRYLPVLLFLVVGGLSVLARGLPEGSGPWSSLSALPQSEGGAVLAALVALVVALALYGLSYLFAARLYSRREF